jgi:hypothetical protein
MGGGQSWNARMDSQAMSSLYRARPSQQQRLALKQAPWSARDTCQGVNPTYRLTVPSQGERGVKQAAGILVQKEGDAANIIRFDNQKWNTGGAR